MSFCKNCDSYLVTVQIEDDLYNECKNCGYKIENKDPIISKKIYKVDAVKNYDINTIYYKYDPSLARTTKVKCPNDKCISYNNEEKQNSIMYKKSDSNKMNYICIHCDTEWNYNS